MQSFNIENFVNQRRQILSLIYITIFPYFVNGQRTRIDYIKYYNYANEAEYYFHEEKYDSMVYFFEKGSKYVDEPYPMHHYKYSKSLWKIGERKKAIKELEEDWNLVKLFVMDSLWFRDMDEKNYHKIIEKMNSSCLNFEIPHMEFLNLLDSLDQKFRRIIKDSILPYHSDNDIIVDRYYSLMREQDSVNGNLIIEFTQNFGFPGGKNVFWNQSIATKLLHMSPNWYIENYQLLIDEIKKGNLEPWQLGRGIDRVFVTETKPILCPYNRYYVNGELHPFLVFQNCIGIGISPYYDFNWLTIPKKTKYFEVYHRNKNSYSAIMDY